MALKKDYYLGSKEEVSEILKFIQAYMRGEPQYYIPDSIRKLENSERPDLKKKIN